MKLETFFKSVLVFHYAIGFYPFPFSEESTNELLEIFFQDNLFLILVYLFILLLNPVLLFFYVKFSRELYLFSHSFFYFIGFVGAIVLYDDSFSITYTESFIETIGHFVTFLTVYLIYFSSLKNNWETKKS